MRWNFGWLRQRGNGDKHCNGTQFCTSAGVLGKLPYIYIYIYIYIYKDICIALYTNQYSPFCDCLSVCLSLLRLCPCLFFLSFFLSVSLSILSLSFSVSLCFSIVTDSFPPLLTDFSIHFLRGTKLVVKLWLGARYVLSVKLSIWYNLLLLAPIFRCIKSLCKMKDIFQRFKCQVYICVGYV